VVMMVKVMKVESKLQVHQKLHELAWGEGPNWQQRGTMDTSAAGHLLQLRIMCMQCMQLLRRPAAKVSRVLGCR
jgi:hypothetical protein